MLAIYLVNLGLISRSDPTVQSEVSPELTGCDTPQKKLENKQITKNDAWALAKLNTW